MVVAVVVNDVRSNVGIVGVVAFVFCYLMHLTLKLYLFSCVVLIPTVVAMVVISSYSGSGFGTRVFEEL